jgi:hypothetical protein
LTILLGKNANGDYSGRNTFWLVKFSSKRLGASHLYNSVIMFHCPPPGSTVHAKKTGPDVTGGDNLHKQFSQNKKFSV